MFSNHFHIQHRPTGSYEVWQGNELLGEFGEYAEAFDFICELQTLQALQAGVVASLRKVE